MRIEREITNLVEDAVRELDRTDLYRDPLVAFSSADDPRYEDLKQIVGDWVRTPKEFLESAQTVVSYFVPFTREVAAAPRHNPQESVLWGESYAVINAYFDRVNARVCEFLRGRGYDAEPVPATHTYNEADMKSAWSHRSAAAIAGLGYFSANRMLVTEKGSGGRYCTVFTSAPTSMRREPPKNRCPYLKNGSCGKCFEACPVGALRPGAIDRFSCQAVTRENEKRILEKSGLAEADVCGKCISVCPLAYLGD